MQLAQQHTRHAAIITAGELRAYQTHPDLLESKAAPSAAALICLWWLCRSKRRAAPEIVCNRCKSNLMGLAGSEIKYICLFWCNSRVRWEYASRINDPVYLFVMYSTSHPLVRLAHSPLPPLPLSFAFSAHTLSRCRSNVLLSSPPPGCPTYGNSALCSRLKNIALGFLLH